MGAQPSTVARQASTSTDTGSAPAATSADGQDSADADRLFRELYPRVRDELRWELRAQRERAGLLADPL